MKILHLSDTHNCHNRLRDLAEADVVVHSGDFCMVGTGLSPPPHQFRTITRIPTKLKKHH